MTLSTTAQHLTSAQPKPRLSERLKRLAEELKDRPLRIHRLQEELHGSDFALILLLFVTPFCLPIDIIPGLSIPCGLAVASIGFRYAAGLNLWLPDWIRKREIRPGHAQRLFSLLAGILRKFERITRPRWQTICMGNLARLVFGLVIASWGLVMCLPLPIPFTNSIPAWGIITVTIGWIERDGVVLLVGYLYLVLLVASGVTAAMFGRHGAIWLAETLGVL